MADPCSPAILACYMITEVEHLPPGPLPLAGAFTTQPFFEAPSAGLKAVTFYITYTRGAVGGFPAFRVEYAPSTGGLIVYRELIMDENSLVIAQPNASVNVYQQEVLGPTPQSAAPILYDMEFTIPPGAIGVRLTAAERGVPATPGTMGITLTGLVSC